MDLYDAVLYSLDHENAFDGAFDHDDEVLETQFAEDLNLFCDSCLTLNEVGELIPDRCSACDSATERYIDQQLSARPRAA